MVMTVLSPMRPETFEAYKLSSCAAYAADKVAAGSWPSEGALALALADLEDSLPQGLATPDHHLFDIRLGEGGPVIGVLWFAVQVNHGLRSAYVYDLEVHAAHRRQGHAQRAFEALELQVRVLGIKRIGLHVFGHNPGAQALYAKLGYGVTGVNMLKQLPPVAV